MGRLKTLTRRAFLVGTAAVAGGVAFGVYTVRRPHENPLLGDLEPGQAALTPYVRIDGDGVTLITPRADKGQGAYHVQAVLLAEELDLDLAEVRVDPGPPSAAYWNTALAPEAAEFTIPAQGMMRDMVEGGLGAVMKVMGMQITGGSTTVADQFDKLRAAAASARETLKLAAADQTGIAVSDIRTENGAVILPDGRAIAYGDLAGVVAGMDVVQDVPLRAPAQWRYIGKPMQRIDMLGKCTGTLDYGIDLDVPGMLQATVVLNPAQGGALNRFDATEAEKMRGVKAVLPVTGGFAVVADNTWRAFQAAQMVVPDWGDTSNMPATMAGHWQALSDAFTDDHQDSRQRDDGDVDSALSGGKIIEAEYRAPYLAHAPLEPISAIVRVDDTTAEVWTGTQIPRFVQTNVARIAGIEADAVTLHVQMMGGSFGHRLEDEVVKQATEIAVQLKGVPIKLTYAREEDMTHDFPRQIAMARLRGKVTNGQVEAMDLSIACPSVIVSQMGRQGISMPGPDSQIVAGAWNAPFAIPHHRVTGYRAAPLAPISSWRSVGASHAGFFQNAALDELIFAAGADPLEERLRLVNDDLAQKALEAVADMSSWDGPLGNGRGRGVALTTSFGVPCAEVIEVSQTEAGLKLDKVWVAAEVGRVVDPVNFENLVQGGVIFALGHAMNCEITYADGIAEQSNYHAYEGMRLYQCPDIMVRGLENGDQVRGIGEPPVPPAAAALAGAIFAATGTRLREMPFNKFVDFA
ncbi:molybdopterin-dependent oxidoreductase [Marinovum sp. 2_MG-2023]|uniref:molybdopterin cofactor-binding domain-containing protein n=1 Tax=unclassified Marinovum TaxID=2647166 RepID=UPI0026E42B71|nr:MULTISPECIES: molybdopterin cofactor-binding domain-containing protein [unclassified Marinovum]MDO6732472.1 molybdopterin-dependent oxidoreductase [Marinovum sp. 2_MG-2023]MDO6781789.1 molybdopterin-dependent oxidoreductase [Marinovum sp. 1_MG-2023]